MTSQPLPQPQEITPLTQRKLEASSLDFHSTKVLMFLGALLIFTSVISTTFSTLDGGFLLDDLLHINYCQQAINGNQAQFLQNFTGNWGGSDLMKSYRPLVSCSIFLDYLIYNIKPWGYHLSNLLLYALTAVGVSLTTLELTGLTGNKNKALTAIWAGLLFSVYPLHAESVAWIIGRVDLLATFFYVVALFTYLRYRLIHEKIYLFSSLIAFLLALVSKEIAISLPLSIFAFALIIANSTAKNSPTRFLTALKETLPYLALLALFALVRTLILGTAIGGYSNQTPDINLVKLLGTFTDKESLAHIISPLSQEYMPLKKWFPLSLGLFAAPFLLYFLGALAGNKRSVGSFSVGFRTIFHLLLLSFITLVPAFQIWHIYPNLVGSRLFYLSSVFLSMALPMAALEHRNLSGKLLSGFTQAGVLSLSLLYILWAGYLQTNFKSFQAAGELMRNATRELAQMVGQEAATAKRPIYLTNLPQDYKGAGLIGRQIYLHILLNKPFSNEDLRRHFVVLEEQPNGLPSLMSNKAHQFLAQAAPNEISLYTPSKATTSLFSKINFTTIETATYPKLDFTIKNLPNLQAQLKDNQEWHLGASEEAQVIKQGQPTLLLSTTGGTIYNGSEKLLKLISNKPLSLKTKLACDLDVTLSNEFQEPPLSLVIFLKNPQTNSTDYLELEGEKNGQTIHFPLSHLRDYVLSKSTEHTLCLKFKANNNNNLIIKDAAFLPSKDI
jgi:hypothetical protein